MDIRGLYDTIKITPVRRSARAKAVIAAYRVALLNLFARLTCESGRETRLTTILEDTLLDVEADSELSTDEQMAIIDEMFDFVSGILHKADNFDEDFEEAA